MKDVDGSLPCGGKHGACFRLKDVGIHAVADREGLSNDLSVVRIHHDQHLRIASRDEEPAALPVHRNRYRLSRRSHLPARFDLQGLRINRDHLIRTPLRASYTGMRNLWLPRTVLDADFLVSMPKIKTHHWSGVTLSMKNMFGVVPGARYGWPKNILHWKGIQESILDLCATVPVHFVIADGIVAMEGNGPLNGTPRRLGTIVLADDPVAADATCARLMGFEPERITHIREGARFLGNASPTLVDQVGEVVNAPATPFQLVPEFRYLHSKGVWL